MNEDIQMQFAQKLIANIKKHGFPEKMVSFDIDTLYEAGQRNGANLNKALTVLHDIQIGHVKTPEKIIFYPRDRMAPPVFDNSIDDADPPSQMPAIDPSLFQGLNFDPESLKGMSLQSIVAKAAELVGQMSPEQLQQIQSTYADMSEEDKAAILSRARDLGIDPPEKK